MLWTIVSIAFVATAAAGGRWRSLNLSLRLLAVLLIYGCGRDLSAAPVVRMFFDDTQTISPVALAEDADGMLWIAADEGVFQFDGKHFLRLEGLFQTPSAIAVVGGYTVLIGANNGVFQYSKGT